MDIESALLVLLVESLVARLVDFAVEYSLLDQELRPLEITVARQERVIEIEKREVQQTLPG